MPTIEEKPAAYIPSVEALASVTWTDARDVRHAVNIAPHELRYRRGDVPGVLVARADAEEVDPAALPAGVLPLLRAFIGGIVDGRDDVVARMLEKVNGHLEADGAMRLSTLAHLPEVVRRLVAERREFSGEVSRRMISAEAAAREFFAVVDAKQKAEERARVAEEALRTARCLPDTIVLDKVAGESPEAVRRRATIVHLIDVLAQQRANVVAGRPEGMGTFAAAVASLGDALGFCEPVVKSATEEGGKRLVHSAGSVPFSPECGADVPDQRTAVYPLAATCEACKRVRALRESLAETNAAFDALLIEQTKTGNDLVTLRRHVRHSLRRWRLLDGDLQKLIRVEALTGYDSLAEQLRQLEAVAFPSTGAAEFGVEQASPPPPAEKLLTHWTETPCGARPGLATNCGEHVTCPACRKLRGLDLPEQTGRERAATTILEVLEEIDRRLGDGQGGTFAWGSERWLPEADLRAQVHRRRSLLPHDFARALADLRESGKLSYVHGGSMRGDGVFDGATYYRLAPAEKPGPTSVTVKIDGKDIRAALSTETTGATS